jgi:mitochondrial fission protein ELM1
MFQGMVTSWILTDGKQGMENQCLGLARALGVDVEVKRVAIRAPWRWLPPGLWWNALATPRDRLGPPWPELLIATGRQTVALSIAIKRASGGRCFTVQLQDPTVSPALFDIVVAPEHDGLSGPNVIATRGAMHGVTAAALAEATPRFRDRLATLPRPLVAVLLGGSNARYRLDREAMLRLGALLRRAAAEDGAGFAITPSRRTDAASVAALRETLSGVACEIWDGTGDNPYLGYLGLADAIVVTSDSVNMTTEACATGKPVHVFHLAPAKGKFGRFHDSFQAAGFTRPFKGRIETWAYDPPQETERVAGLIRARIKDRA